MSLYPIYIDSSVSGAQLSIGATNTSTILLGNANCSTNIYGNVSIGNVSATNVSIGTLSVINPITIGYSVKPTTSNQIGWSSIITTNTASTITNGTYYTVCSVPTISIGTYIFSYSYYPTVANTCTASLMIGVYLGTSVTGTTAPTIGLNTINNGAYSLNAYGTNQTGSGAFVNTNSTNNVYLQFTVMGGSGAVSWTTAPGTTYNNGGLFFSLVRIA
jgi:hypothetical protein